MVCPLRKQKVAARDSKEGSCRGEAAGERPSTCSTDPGPARHLRYAKKSYPKSPTDCYPLVAQGLGFVAGGKQVPILLKPYEKKMIMFCFKPLISQAHILQGNASLTGAAKGFGRRTMRTLPTTRQSKMINPSSCCTWLLRCKGEILSATHSYIALLGVT